ncbi:MAG: serine hydrolase domain-containing protein, partial [Acidobacteriota bacterium]
MLDPVKPPSLKTPRSFRRQASPLAALLVAVPLALACATEPSPAPAEPASAAGAFPYAEQIVRSLEPAVPVEGQQRWTLEERMERYRAPALSVAVWHDYAVVWTAAFGTADVESGRAATPETLFQAGSISKPVAAAAVLASWQRGELDLDAPINSILTSWKLPENELTEKSPVTPRRLLSHTAGTTVHGFPGYAVDEPVPSVPQILDGAAPANTSAVRVDLEPGERFRYSGGGSTVMQLAMTDLTGLPYPELTRQSVLEPLGMSSSTYENPLPAERLPLAAAGYWRNGREVWGKRHTYPEMAAAGLWTTPSDLARFALDLQRALRGDEGTLLSQETVRAMITPVSGRSGLGFFEYESNGALYFGHGGADEGFQAWLIASQEGGHGAAIMVNSDYGITLAEELVPAISRVLGWPGFAPEPITPESVDPASLDALAGLYRMGEHLLLEVSRQGDALMARGLFEEEATRLVPQEGGVFVAQSDGARLGFKRAEDGRATALFDAENPEAGLLPRLDEEKPIAEVLLVEGSTQAALDLLAVDGASEDTLNNLGYTLLRSQRPEQAEAVLRLAAERHPLSANASDSLGDAHHALGDYAAAADAFRAVHAKLEGDPNLSDEEKA